MQPSCPPSKHIATWLCSKPNFPCVGLITFLLSHHMNLSWDSELLNGTHDFLSIQVRIRSLCEKYSVVMGLLRLW
jgi:hypothetical protein